MSSNRAYNRPVIILSCHGNLGDELLAAYRGSYAVQSDGLVAGAVLEHDLAEQVRPKSVEEGGWKRRWVDECVGRLAWSISWACWTIGLLAGFSVNWSLCQFSV